MLADNNNNGAPEKLYFIGAGSVELQVRLRQRHVARPARAPWARLVLSGVVLEVPARLPDPHMRMFVFPPHLPPRTWLILFLSRHPPNASLNNPASLNQKIPAECLSSLFNLSPDLRTATAARSPPSAANLCILLVAVVGLDPRRVRAPEAPEGVRGRHFRGDGLLPEDPAGVSRGRAGAVPPAHARQGWDGRHAGRCVVGVRYTGVRFLDICGFFA